MDYLWIIYDYSQFMGKTWENHVPKLKLDVICVLMVII